MKLLSRREEVITYIYGRTMLISILKMFTKGRDLIRPEMTRFFASYLTLACLYEMKTSLMTMFNFEEWKTRKFHGKGEKFKMWY